jgi:hypothetical protein
VTGLNLALDTYSKEQELVVYDRAVYIHVPARLCRRVAIAGEIG